MKSMFESMVTTGRSFTILVKRSMEAMRSKQVAVIANIAPALVATFKSTKLKQKCADSSFN